MPADKRVSARPRGVDHLTRLGSHVEAAPSNVPASVVSSSDGGKPLGMGGVAASRNFSLTGTVPSGDRTTVTRSFIFSSKTGGKRTAHHYAAHGVTRPLYRKGHK